MKNNEFNSKTNLIKSKMWKKRYTERSKIRAANLRMAQLFRSNEFLSALHTLYCFIVQCIIKNLKATMAVEEFYFSSSNIMRESNHPSDCKRY